MIRLLKNLLSKPLQTAYYQSRETLLGDHKRDLVVLQVDQACNSLKESRDQFIDALEQFKLLVHVDESPLQLRYQLLKRHYEQCKYKAEQLSQRIQAIEHVSEALFTEWETELDLYTNRLLRSRSHQQLKKSRQQYARLVKTLQIAESRIHPVLADFQDQVLSLKHNLNAYAIAALRNDFIEIGLDISKLVAVMERTIIEASQFVSDLSDQKQLTASTQKKRIT